MHFSGSIVVKNPLTNAGDTGVVGSIPGSGRSPGEGNGNPVFLPGKSHEQRSLAGYRQSTGSQKTQTQLSK